MTPIEDKPRRHTGLIAAVVGLVLLAAVGALVLISGDDDRSDSGTTVEASNETTTTSAPATVPPTQANNPPASSCPALPIMRPSTDGMGGASLSGITTAKQCDLTVTPSAACSLENTVNAVEVTLKVTGFTALGQYDTVVWTPSGKPYDLSRGSRGDIDANGNLSFGWTCETQDMNDPGLYVFILTDRTSRKWVPFFIGVEKKP